MSPTHDLAVKKAIQQGNTEGARIYAQNAIREKNQQVCFFVKDIALPTSTSTPVSDSTHEHIEQCTEVGGL